MEHVWLLRSDRDMARRPWTFVLRGVAASAFHTLKGGAQSQGPDALLGAAQQGEGSSRTAHPGTAQTACGALDLAFVPLPLVAGAEAVSLLRGQLAPLCQPECLAKGFTEES